MDGTSTARARRPSWLPAAAVTLALTSGMVYIRLVVYPGELVPLTYALPLLAGLWHRNRVLLWGMAGCFLLVAALKTLWLVPDRSYAEPADQVVFTLMQWLNIVLPAGVVHLVVNYRERLLRSNEALSEANVELETSNEELTARDEEITRQNEELQSQTEELEQQTEELRSQAEELEELNAELTDREKSLRGLLHLAGSACTEADLWQEICHLAAVLLGEGAPAAMVLERRDDHYLVRGRHGIDDDCRIGPALPAGQLLADLVMQRDETAQVEDLELRPDLRLPLRIGGRPCRAVLSAPLRFRDASVGVLEVYATEPGGWPAHRARLLDWLARQCSLALESIRVREELRESEQQFHSLAESIPQLAWMAHPDGYIFWYNQRWYDYTGTTLDEMKGWGWQAVHDPAELPRVVEHFRHSFATGTPWEDTFPLRRHDGAMRWHLSRALPLRDAEGRIVRWFGTNTDITERRETELALQQSREEAEEASLAKSRFVANISHELRTPMNAILGMLDVVLRRVNDAVSKDCLQTARESADLLLALLDDLLDSAKIEAGRLELQPAAFCPRHVIEQTSRALAVRASEKGLIFHCRMPADLPEALVGDAVRLRQVLFNLVGNAIKFTESGEVQLSVEIASQSAEQVRLRFAVKDTGIGVAPADLERIFQPFAQGDGSAARRFGGTGLGLSICASLVSMMGGRLEVESQPGRGSTFHFTISLPVTDDVPRAADEPSPLSAAAPARLRVLLAEDNRANQKLASHLLNERGHAVDIAGDGQEALQRVQQNEYHVVLMDVQMPGMDGFEAAAAIRALPDPRGRIPIVAMTAHAADGDRQRCLEHGMDEYLSKPIDAREMIAMVERMAAPGLPEPRCETVGEGTPAADAPASGEAESAPSDGAPVFDPTEAVRRCFRKQVMFDAMVDFYFADMETLLPKMREAIQGSNWEELARLTHRLKGTVAYLAADRASAAIHRLERVARESGPASDAESALALFEGEADLLTLALRAHRAASTAQT